MYSINETEKTRCTDSRALTTFNSRLG